MAKPVAPRGEARTRVLEAARDLFAEHGVSGTSLQMIADHIGVTKAAVYFQFRTKDEIVAALAQPAFEAMQRFVSAAEAEPDPVRRRELALRGLVDIVISDRRGLAMLHTDPAIAEMVGLDAHRQDLVRRMGRALLGDHPTVDQRVALRLFGTGVLFVGRGGDLQDVDDDSLQAALLAAGQRLFGSPAAGE